MRHLHLFLASTSLLAAIGAQGAAAEPVTEARLKAAYEDARAACKEVLAAELETLPPLKLVEKSAVAAVVAEENLPSIRLRQPDEEKARAEATVLGKQFGDFAFAKYAWSTRSLMVVPKSWEENARLLEKPELTSDHVLRAVLVHELCHALDDQKFDLGKRVLEAKTVDVITALNAVIEGHAQLATRRVCKVRGWADGFETFTGSIAALPEKSDDGEAMRMLRSAQANALAFAYVDGERFAAAVLDARPETGRADIFSKPPLDAETVLQPQWYLDPSKRPAVFHDPEPAIDAFVAKFDAAVWSNARSSPTAKQIATGLTLLPGDDVDAIVGSLRSSRFVQLVPTAAPQSKVAILAVLEFDTEQSAERWVRLMGVLSDAKDEAMSKGTLRIKESKTTKLDDGPVRGLVQEKTMQSGRTEFAVVAIDAWRGRVVVETIHSGEPPPVAEQVKTVGEALTMIVGEK